MTLAIKHCLRLWPQRRGVAGGRHRAADRAKRSGDLSERCLKHRPELVEVRDDGNSFAGNASLLKPEASVLISREEHRVCQPLDLSHGADCEDRVIHPENDVVLAELAEVTRQLPHVRLRLEVAGLKLRVVGTDAAFAREVLQDSHLLEHPLSHLVAGVRDEPDLDLMLLAELEDLTHVGDGVELSSPVLTQELHACRAQLGGIEGSRGDSTDLIEQTRHLLHGEWLSHAEGQSLDGIPVPEIENIARHSTARPLAGVGPRPPMHRAIGENDHAVQVEDDPDASFLNCHLRPSRVSVYGCGLVACSDTPKRISKTLKRVATSRTEMEGQIKSLQNHNWFPNPQK